ncbi:MAG TPA: phage holin family protein [Acetobacterium sp.]
MMENLGRIGFPIPEKLKKVLAQLSEQEKEKY